MKYVMAILMMLIVGSPALAQTPQEAQHTVETQFVEPSAKAPIKSGMKIEALFTRNMKQPYVLQRLTDRSYFFQRFFYSTTFYVGDEGVLLFDAPEGRGSHPLGDDAPLGPWAPGRRNSGQACREVRRTLGRGRARL